ncbi:hypothetical protein D3C84_33370 [compost metagenome]
MKCQKTIFIFFILSLSIRTTSLKAQELEPRTYTNIPIGLNFLINGYAYSRGDLSFGPNLPITNAQLNISTTVIAYARSFSFAGKSAKIDAVIPYTWVNGTALYNNEPIGREVNGLTDSRFRLSVNLIGAPALTLKEFKNHNHDLFVGISLQTTVPSGQYDSSKLVNIGTNRWAFKSEIGASKAIKKWIFELTASTTFYTPNNNFYGGKTREQDILYSIQGHTIYSFRNGIWIAADATYYEGGRTTVDNLLNNDLQENWRLGTTLSFPLTKLYSAKLYASSGVAARTGNNYDLVGIGIQYRWGQGLTKPIK